MSVAVPNSCRSSPEHRAASPLAAAHRARRAALRAKMGLAGVSASSSSSSSSRTDTIHAAATPGAPAAEGAAAATPARAVRSAMRSGKLSGNKLPLSLFTWCVTTGLPLSLVPPSSSASAASSKEWSAFALDTYFATRAPPKALLCLPVLRLGVVFGVLYLENDFASDAFTSSHMQLLQLLCGQAALSIDNARLYSQLFAQNASLEQQKAQLEQRNLELQQLSEAAEKATRAKSEFLAVSRISSTASHNTRCG